MSDLRYFDDVGDHNHHLLRNQKATDSSGNHMHVWLVTEDVKVGDYTIRENSLILSSYDGAHDHSLGEAGLTLTSGGEHRHGVRLPGARTEGTDKGGAHAHDVLVRRTGTAGPHAHSLTLGGVTMKSLMVEDFLRLFALEDAQEEGEEMEIEYSVSREQSVAKHLKKVTGMPVYGIPPEVTKAEEPKLYLSALARLAEEL